MASRMARLQAQVPYVLGGGETPLEVQQERRRQADIRTTTGYGGVPLENRRTANSRLVRTILLRKFRTTVAEKHDGRRSGARFRRVGL